ncbi:hypothetical protein ACFL03_15850 [Thermodesulfobacteriota bacterium]
MTEHLETRRREHWGKLGINNEKRLRDYIKAIFKQHDHQTDVLIDIYKMILPDWDSIKEIDGHPEAGHSLWTFICNQFIEFDHKYHPKVFKGGIWLNTGFSANSNLKPWETSLENCTVIMN